jgi:hypothetical protein
MSEESSQSGSMPAPPPSSGRRPKVDASASAEVSVSEEKAVAPKSEPVKRSSGPFMVVALRAGFFERVRRAPGDKFMVPDESKLGSWMKKV